jgi:hypothetical protein
MLGAADHRFAASRVRPSFWPRTMKQIENRRSADASRFSSLVVLYKASSEYKALADSTRRNWSPWLDRIAERSVLPNSIDPKKFVL